MGRVYLRSEYIQGYRGRLNENKKRVKKGEDESRKMHG